MMHSFLKPPRDLLPGGEQWVVRRPVMTRLGSTARCSIRTSEICQHIVTGFFKIVTYQGRGMFKKDTAAPGTQANEGTRVFISQ